MKGWKKTYEFEVDVKSVSVHELSIWVDIWKPMKVEVTRWTDKKTPDFGAVLWWDGVKEDPPMSKKMEAVETVGMGKQGGW